MTFATIDSRETTTTYSDTLRAIITALITRINAYRAERKELRSLYHYHSEKSADLEQAKRDVNRVWQGHY